MCLVFDFDDEVCEDQTFDTDLKMKVALIKDAMTPGNGDGGDSVKGIDDFNKVNNCANGSATSGLDQEILIKVVPQGKVQCKDSLGKYEQKIGRQL